MKPWPEIWSECIKDAAIKECTPEFLLYERLRTALADAERQRDEADAALLKINEIGFDHFVRGLQWSKYIDDAITAARARQAAKEPR